MGFEEPRKRPAGVGSGDTGTGLEGSGRSMIAWFRLPPSRCGPSPLKSNKNWLIEVGGHLRKFLDNLEENA